MTEIKKEPIDEDGACKEIVEVKDPLEIKLEPVVLEMPVVREDVDLDSIDISAHVEDEKKCGEVVDSDEDYEAHDTTYSGIDDEDTTESTFDEDEEDDDDIVVDNSEETDNEEDQKTTSIEIEGMTIVQKGQYSKCPKCKKFIKSTFIIRHIKLHDANPEKVKCPDGCDLTFARINNMFRHLKKVHKSKEPYVCKHADCGKRFAKSKSLASHLAVHRAEKRKAKEKAEEEEEAEEGRYACEFPGCDKSYGKKHHLKEHERKHTGDMKYACEVCGKKFYIHAHMKRHMYSHTGLKPHVCRWKCGLTFASYGGRMKHERINHYEANPLESTCDVCGRPFKNQQQLVKHRMTHLNPEERKEYRCSYCNIMFDTIKIRIRHEKRHKDGDTFSCPECERQFSNEKNLAHHIKHHHSVAAAENQAKKKRIVKKNSAPSAPKPAPKTHPCHLCNPTKMFCLTSLRRHLARIHSTNFKCEKCGKGYQEESRFKAHVEIHRLRECHICGKVFARKQNADIHLIGLHKLTPADLAKLGRWNPRKDTDECPDYMTRASHKSRAEIERMEAASHADDIDIKEEPLDAYDDDDDSTNP